MELVYLHDNKAVTSSRLVAQTFGKAHKDVLRAIRNVDCSSIFNQRNFAPVKYLDQKGESRIEYILTRDGFTFLVMGFTGAKAAQFKEQYINAFNAMETALSKPQQQLSPADILLQSAMLLKDHETRLKQVEAKVTTKDESYYTISGFSRLHGLSMPVSEARRLGKQAKKLSDELNYAIGSEHDAKYGHINSYHEEILTQVFNQKLLAS